MSQHDSYKLRVLEFLGAAVSFVMVAAMPAAASLKTGTSQPIPTAQKLVAIREATSEAMKSLGTSTPDETPKELLLAQWLNWMSWSSWRSWSSWSSWSSWRSWPNY